MMKTFLSLLLSVTAAFNVAGATIGSDFANDPAYDDAWTDGDDGGTPATFLPWGLQQSGTGTRGFVIESSTLGGGNINTGGEAFGIFAQGTGTFVDAFRTFGAPLELGQTFSFNLSVNFTDGNKGFSLRDGNTNIFNLNISSGGYTINASTVNGSLGGYNANTMFSIQLTQSDATSGTWTVSRTGGITANATGTYNGVGTNFQFYNGQTGERAENNLYFNNLAVTAIPEPSTVSLLASAAIFAGCFYARHRKR